MAGATEEADEVVLGKRREGKGVLWSGSGQGW